MAANSVSPNYGHYVTMQQLAKAATQEVDTKTKNIMRNFAEGRAEELYEQEVDQGLSPENRLTEKVVVMKLDNMQQYLGIGPKTAENIRSHFEQWA